jgi:hypothetical protein
MDLDERAVKIVEEAETLSVTDLRGALAKMREALIIEPDYPNLEDEIFIREDAIAKLDGVLEYIVVLLREGNDYQACEMLQGLPDNYIIQDKSGLVSGLVEKIKRAESLVFEARELAKKDPVKALAIFEKAYGQVADYPGLVEEMAVFRHGSSRYESTVEAIGHALRNKDVKKAVDLLGDFREEYPGDENIGRLKAAIVNLSKELIKKKDRKINFIAITAVVVLLLAVVCAYFSFEMFTFKNADRKWRELERLLTAGEFAESLTLGRELKQDLGRVHLFYLGGKQELLVKVEDVLHSDAVIKGAEGKVLFEGEYIPEVRLAGIKALQKNLDEGRALAATAQCGEAIKKFEAALAVAMAKEANATAEVIDEIKLSISDCRLNIVRKLVSEAVALKAAGSFDAALSGVNEALVKADGYAVGDGGGIVAEALSLKIKINRAKLKELIAVGDEFSGAGAFDKAVSAYRQAAAFAEANELTGDPLNRQLPELINKSKVELVMGSGDRGFAAGNWQEATLAYEKGMALARELNQQGLPSFKRARMNLAQSKKMEVATEIQRLDKLAEKTFKAGKNKEARRIYEQAMELAGKSKWRESREVAAVFAEVKRGFAEVEEKIFVEDKKGVLLERYSAVLKRDFELEKDATLLDPEVVLMDSSPEFLEFSLSAMAYAQKGTPGRQYTRYQAIYLFDRKTRSWRLVDKIGNGGF